MKEIDGLKIEYIEPQIDYDEKAEHQRLLRFITLISQVGFQEVCLNPNTTIDFNFS